MAAYEYDLGILGGGAAGLTAAAGVKFSPRGVPADASKKAAGSYYSEKLFGDRTKKILRFLFDLKGRASTTEGGAG